MQRRFRTDIYLIYLLVFAAFCSQAIAQRKTYGSEEEKIQVVEQRIEWLAENLGDEQPDLTVLFDRLMYYIRYPLNLNTASKTDLAELTLLNAIQIDELISHIARNGKLISIYEVQCLPSWDLITIENVLPFVYVNDRFNQPHLTFAQMLEQSGSELYLRWGKVLEEQKGYTPDPVTGETKYLGSNDRLYTRYRFRSGNNISLGFTAEKDPGEEFFRGTQKKGFDFYSAHLYVKDIGIIRHAVVGDYLAAFGQGLTMGMGVAFGKSANSLAVKRQVFKIKPYTSVAENTFLRGAATTLRIKNIDLTLFYSGKKIDANITSTISDTVNTSQDDGLVVSSLQTSGLHTTPNEVSDKNAIGENLAGGNITYAKRTYEIGATFYAVKYSGTLNKNLQPYNQFDFTGQSNAVGGLHYAWLIRNFHFFGETSMSRNKALGTVNGVMVGLDPRLGFVLLQRYYQKDFQNLYANAIAEGSRPVNENGLYYGIEFKPGNKWSLNAYADMFKSEWLRFGVDAPSKGTEYLAQLAWRPNKQTEIYIRYRQREKEFNTDITGVPIEYTVTVNQRNYRFNLVHKINRFLSLHTRYEQVVIIREDNPVNIGYLAFQDILFKPLLSPFSFNVRYAIFNTQDYDSRIYAYENDILYYYSIPSYYYKGSRMYLNIRYQYKKWLDIWFKIGQWLYDNRKTVGSGNDEINGNSKTDFRLQIRFSF